jgi:hypothetical protein
VTVIYSAKRKSPELVLMDVGQSNQLFSRRTLRKACTCAACKRTIATGDVGYGEVTSSAMNRRLRFCEPCIDAAIRGAR